MGMFGDLMNKIFHHGAEAERPTDAAPRPAPESGSTTSMAPQGGASGSAPTGPVDVAKVLDTLAAQHTAEKLDWKHSIVDMLKLVGMDSSMAARKDLASDLHYTGDSGDSAAMNTWLHKEVLKKLAENGGKVPADLLNH